MTRSLIRYAGEDQSPATELVDYVKWEEVEAGQRAYRGQSSISTFKLRDELAQMGPWIELPISLATRNIVQWREGSNTLFRGRIVPRDWFRGAQKGSPAREVSMDCEDYNTDLRGIIVDNWARPAETDKQRAQALVAGYLKGSPRRTTDLQGSNLISSSNTVNLPAKVYSQTDPLGVLTDIASQANKFFFVTIDGELFYDGNDSTAYRCPYYITDRDETLRADPTHALSIIPDMGPLFTIDGQQMITGTKVKWGPNDRDVVSVSNPTYANIKGHWEEMVYANDATTPAEASNYANSVLANRSQDGRTMRCTVGRWDGTPLTEAEVGSIKPGQLITITADALPGVTESSRIVDCRWSTPVPGYFFAHLQLERPGPTSPGGGGAGPGGGSPTSAPPSSGDACCLDAPDEAHEAPIEPKALSMSSTEWEYDIVNGVADSAWNAKASGDAVAGMSWAVFDGDADAICGANTMYNGEKQRFYGLLINLTSIPSDLLYLEAVWNWYSYSPLGLEPGPNDYGPYLLTAQRVAGSPPPIDAINKGIPVGSVGRYNQVITSGAPEKVTIRIPLGAIPTGSSGYTLLIAAPQWRLSPLMTCGAPATARQGGIRSNTPSDQYKAYGLTPAAAGWQTAGVVGEQNAKNRSFVLRGGYSAVRDVTANGLVVPRSGWEAPDGSQLIFRTYAPLESDDVQASYHVRAP